jgi:hypothetical protein
LQISNCFIESQFTFSILYFSTYMGTEFQMNTLNRSALKTKKDLPYFEIPEIASLGWIEHGFLTRKGGVSLPPYESLNLSHDHGDRDDQVFQNRVRIATTFGFESNRLVLLNQMHQDRILLVREPNETTDSRLEYDALITDTPRTFLGIRTADCLPIFIVEEKSHCGCPCRATGNSAPHYRQGIEKDGRSVRLPASSSLDCNGTLYRPLLL